ncbi:MAG: non-canonical purine pyrophosphatase [Bacilli bacterium]|nr:non-canonical purine pyrophosphatase [Bacilli bacterium]
MSGKPRMAKSILLATRNPGKLREFQEYLSSLSIEVLPLPADAPEVEETGDTFAENARLKAETIMQRYLVPVLADDSGLEVDVLGGAPGVWSARYAGQQATDEENNAKLLAELYKAEAFPNCTSARFIAVLAFASPGRSTEFVSGTCEGKILASPRGTNGFGYDPLFCLIEMERTLAELTVAEKNRVSHRAKALESLISLPALRNV